MPVRARIKQIERHSTHDRHKHVKQTKQADPTLCEPERTSAKQAAPPSPCLKEAKCVCTGFRERGLPPSDLTSDRERSTRFIGAVGDFRTALEGPNEEEIPRRRRKEDRNEEAIPRPVRVDDYASTAEESASSNNNIRVSPRLPEVTERAPRIFARERKTGGSRKRSR